MQQKNQGRRYDSNRFYWALMYQASRRCVPRISEIHPRQSDAKRRAMDCNRYWKEQGLGKEVVKAWTVKRFKFYFRGTEIDAYAHEFQREEVSGSKKISVLPAPELFGKLHGVDVFVAPYPPEVKVWTAKEMFAKK